jgi:tungstate transport system substrate-binding protein
MVRHALRIGAAAALIWLLAAGCAPAPVQHAEVILATTTSTQDSGLLDVLVPLFQQQTGYQLKTVSVGTGAALALGGRGEADVVLVHAPESEKQWMAQGNGTARVLVMHNDFILVGPSDDPVKLKGSASAVDALKKLASRQATFVSRGDNSGTQQAELALWKQAQVEPKGQAWYVESGTGMGQTLAIADQKRAYTLADRATWLAWTDKVDLPIVVEGDKQLFNVYHVMPVSPARFPTVKINAAGAQAFADFLVAPATQEVIGNFGIGKYGQQLFVPDAGKQDADVGG